jgi:hypothetical protein
MAVSFSWRDFQDSQAFDSSIVVAQFSIDLNFGRVISEPRSSNPWIAGF